MLWLAVFVLAFADSFAAFEELAAIARVWKAKGWRQRLLAIWVAAWWTKRDGSRHLEVGVVPWVLAMNLIQTANGLLVYRMDPWLAVPENLGSVLGAGASLMWRGWRKRKKRREEQQTIQGG